MHEKKKNLEQFKNGGNSDMVEISIITSAWPNKESDENGIVFLQCCAVELLL